VEGDGRLLRGPPCCMVGGDLIGKLRPVGEVPHPAKEEGAAGKDLDAFKVVSLRPWGSAERCGTPEPRGRASGLSTLAMLFGFRAEEGSAAQG
jgi:hypothetical protein